MSRKLLALLALPLLGCEPVYSDADRDALMERFDALEALVVGDVYVDYPMANVYGDPWYDFDRERARAEAVAWARFEVFVEDAEAALLDAQESAGACDAEQAQVDLGALDALDIVRIYGIVGVEEADGELLVEEVDCWTLEKVRVIAASQGL